jgi:hypothetical protein
LLHPHTSGPITVKTDIDPYVAVGVAVSVVGTGVGASVYMYEYELAGVGLLPWPPVVEIAKVWVGAPHVTPLPPPQLLLPMHGRMTISDIPTVLHEQTEAPPPAWISKPPHSPSAQMTPSQEKY